MPAKLAGFGILVGFWGVWLLEGGPRALVVDEAVDLAVDEAVDLVDLVVDEAVNFVVDLVVDEAVDEVVDGAVDLVCLSAFKCLKSWFLEWNSAPQLLQVPGLASRVCEPRAPLFWWGIRRSVGLIPVLTGGWHVGKCLKSLLREANSSPHLRH